MTSNLSWISVPQTHLGQLQEQLLLLLLPLVPILDYSMARGSLSLQIMAVAPAEAAGAGDRRARVSRMKEA